MERKMNFPIGGHWPTNPNNNYRRSSATFYNVHSEPLSVPNTPFFTTHPPSIGVEIVAPISPIVSNSAALLQDASAVPSRLRGTNCPNFQVQETTRTPFLRVVDFFCIVCFTLSRRFIYWKLIKFMTLSNKWGACPTVRNFTGEKTIALQAS